MVVVDPAYEGAGQAGGMEIWRVEKMEIVKRDPATHGQFHEGDSYIILKTTESPGGGGLSWDIHFWLGKETSQDEAGVAAYKTVELDDVLGGTPVQYREVQDHESKKFLSYFKKGIKYLPGGVATGFRHVEEEEYETRLLQIKGKRNVKVRQVGLEKASLNLGDVFILDAGMELICWNGSQSNMFERLKGMTVAKKIRDEERSGKAKVIIVDKDHCESDSHFFELLGAEPGDIPEEGAVPSEVDAAHERNADHEVKLYKVSDASGDLEVTEVAGKPLKKDHLDTNDCFILDGGPSGIFVWTGIHCSPDEKKTAMKKAVGFLSQKGYPNWTQVTRVVENGETPLFKQYFSEWPERYAQVGLGNVYTVGTIAKIDPNEPFDASTLHAIAEKEAARMPDDASGDVKIYRVEDMDKVEIDEAQHGIFFGGDSYVIQYDNPGSNVKIVYFWQGLRSSTDEKGASALLAKQVDEEEFGGSATQIRVVQGKEPEHFLRIFKGKMITFSGGKGSGFKNLREHDSYDADGTRLFQIKGTSEVNTRAVQVAEEAAALNSSDVFVLETPGNTYLWFGKGSLPIEKQFAKNIASTVSPGSEPVEVAEGSEPDEFWEALGGKGEYGSDRMLAGVISKPSRLFQCSNASGRFLVEEIVDFAQDDLAPDDVMLLDAFDTIFLWIGSGANDTEKERSLQTAGEYVDTDPTNRTADDVVTIQVKQGSEPPNFTAHFLGFDPGMWEATNFDSMRAEIEGSNPEE
ncbi:AVIL [Branchiostoma lanceolatum]|uniref:AVIL protein n=1 Tax=Branchiostoma lanceolatum TaxID=7740 RepID=A0A8K0EF04_BRALA|nr:AVIL [Branchiostoma lanceolatum]